MHFARPDRTFLHFIRVPLCASDIRADFDHFFSKDATGFVDLHAYAYTTLCIARLFVACDNVALHSILRPAQIIARSRFMGLALF